MKYKPVPSKNQEWDVPYMPYWTHELLVNDWPPGWLPQEWGTDSSAMSNLATENREKQVALGRMGTIVGLSDKSDKRARDQKAPQWMRP